MSVLRRSRSALARLARQEVPVGWTAALVPLPVLAIVGVGRYTDGALPWLNRHFSLGWLVLLALAIAAFSSAYVATEAAPPLRRRPRRPPIIRRFGAARLMAMTGLFFCVYLLSVLSWYVSDGSSSRRAGELTWWGVPLALCFWTLGAVEIANETEHSGSGEPADPEREWTWFVRLRRSAIARRLAYIFLFGGTIAFAVAGSVPGVVWRRAHPGEVPAWQGHGYVTTSIYNYGVAVWAGLLLVAATAFLGHSFYTRPLGLPSAVLRRAWYSLWAAAAVVLMMPCFGLAAQGLLAEPMIDLALALYGLWFAVMLIEASAATRHRRMKSSLTRRIVGAAAVIGFTFALAVQVKPSLAFFRTGVLTAAIAALVPLVPTILRALFGIERLPADSVTPQVAEALESNLLVAPIPTEPAQREAIYSIMVGEEPLVEPSLDAVAHWNRTLMALSGIELPALQNAPTRHALQYLLFTCDDGLKNSKKWAPPEQMVVLLEQLFEGDLDEQKYALIELMRRSADVLAGGPLDVPGPKKAPRPLEVLEMECIARLPKLPDNAEERARWQRLRAARREWLTGRIDTWTGAMQSVEAAPRQGKVAKGKGAQRAKLLLAACETVMAWWLDNLQTAIMSAAQTGDHEDLPVDDL